MTDRTAVPTGNAYDKYASTNRVERRLMLAFFAALDRALPEAVPLRVLEVGVGEGEVSGRLARRWPSSNLVGLDLPDPEVAAHWAGAAFRPLFGDIGRLPFADGTFDLVVAIEVLEHVADPAGAVAELARVVGRGDIVASVPLEPVWRLANMARGKYLGRLGNTPGHVNHWSRRGFTELIGAQLEVRRVLTPLPWTMVAASAR